MATSLRLGSRRPAVAAAVAALLAAGCASTTPSPAAGPLLVSDVETVFFGFDDPAERVSDRMMQLYGDGSVPLEITAGQPDGETLQVEVRSDASEEGERAGGVRCFEYQLDELRQQANLWDLTSSACGDLTDGGDAG
jgi:hypothetical protein